MAWQRVASLSDVSSDRALPVNVGGKALALYLIEGRVYALEDICPHAYALLSDGFVDGDVVECPLHQAAFHIPTGKCVAAPADRDLATFQVKIDGNDILIDLE